LAESSVVGLNRQSLLVNLRSLPSPALASRVLAGYNDAPAESP